MKLKTDKKFIKEAIPFITIIGVVFGYYLIGGWDSEGYFFKHPYRLIQDIYGNSAPSSEENEN